MRSRFRSLLPFPTRRSSDLALVGGGVAWLIAVGRVGARAGAALVALVVGLDLWSADRRFFVFEATERGDRKSTRLNSSHLVISYAVFCLKEKNIIKNTEEHT